MKRSASDEQRFARRTRPSAQQFDDAIDQQIAASVQRENSHSQFEGSPSRMGELIGVIDLMLSRAEDPDDLRITIHSSCVTQQDCVVLSILGEPHRHYNTRNMRDWDRQQFILKEMLPRQVVVQEFQDD